MKTITIEHEVDRLKKGDLVGFAGILATDYRLGKFIKWESDILARVDYGDHNELNHKTNLFIPSSEQVKTFDEAVKYVKENLL